VTGRNGQISGHYDSHLEFYQDVYAHAVKEVRPAGRTGAVMFFAEQDAGDWSDAATPDLIIAETVVFPGVSTVDLGAGRFRTAPMCHGSFICIAPSAATSILVEKPHKIRITAIPYKELCALGGYDTALPPAGDFGVLHTGMIRDARASSLLDRLWSEASAGSPYGALLADALHLQLVAELLRLKDGGAASLRPALDWRMRRAVEYMKAHLADDVSLAEVAAEVGLSPRHLATSFCAATGLPPHRWLMRHRIERACELLAKSNNSITEIAFTCGYSSSQHFATAFRQQMGSTPSAYRQESQC
jgi:AraC family transcriptional regulator